MPPLCRERQSLGQQMLELSCENATVGKNGLRYRVGTLTRTKINHASLEGLAGECGNAFVRSLFAATGAMAGECDVWHIDNI